VAILKRALISAFVSPPDLWAMSSRMARARSSELVKRSDFKRLSVPAAKLLRTRLGDPTVRDSNLGVKSTVYLLVRESYLFAWNVFAQNPWPKNHK
jgi:hypothetical protein